MPVIHPQPAPIVFKKIKKHRWSRSGDCAATSPCRLSLCADSHPMQCWGRGDLGSPGLHLGSFNSTPPPPCCASLRIGRHLARIGLLHHRLTRSGGEGGERPRGGGRAPRRERVGKPPPPPPPLPPPLPPHRWLASLHFSHHYLGWPLPLDHRVALEERRGEGHRARRGLPPPRPPSAAAAPPKIEEGKGRGEG